jgi:hypothetical protein
VDLGEVVSSESQNAKKRIGNLSIFAHHRYSVSLNSSFAMIIMPSQDTKNIKSIHGHHVEEVAKRGMAHPKKPLNPYQRFFREERCRLLGLPAPDPESCLYSNAEKRKHRRTHGRLTFQQLSKQVSQAWRESDKWTKQRMSEEHQVLMNIYKQQQKEQQQKQEQNDQGNACLNAEMVTSTKHAKACYRQEWAELQCLLPCTQQAQPRLLPCTQQARPRERMAHHRITPVPISSCDEAAISEVFPSPQRTIVDNVGVDSLELEEVQVVLQKGTADIENELKDLLFSNPELSLCLDQLLRT